MKYVMLYHNTLYRYRTIRRYEAITSTVHWFSFLVAFLYVFLTETRVRFTKFLELSLVWFKILSD